jgi:tRNA pseudouridine55 synthase
VGERRIGHAGTLDPDATGVLLLGIGQVTRLLRFLGAGRKEYVGEVVLGVETDTLDAAGSVVATHDVGPVDVDRVREVVAESLTGEILQVPPMVSALKVEGRRLHELAREGLEVDRAPRPVTIHHFDVEPADEPHVLRIAVGCSSGTYVRSLAADLGRLLGTGAHLRNLRRTAVGSFTLADAHPLEELVVLPIAEAARDLDRVTVDEVEAKAVGHGRPLERELIRPTALFDAEGRLMAVYEPAGRGAKAAVVLAAT